MDIEELYRQMLRIRLFEEALLGLFSKGVLRGTVHTCLGQEACAVGTVGSLDPERDTVCSNHRGHGHFLAFHGDMEGLFAEIMGLSSGVCFGIGGSQHLHKQNFFSNGILGGMVPVASGLAMAHKRDGLGGVSVVFVGDGAMAEGVIYESLNMASLWKLPLLLVIEHNKIAQTTPWELAHGSQIGDRPPAFGVPVTMVDGNDIFAVRSVTEKILKEMRRNPSPHCLLLDTYRLGPHSKGDDTRSPEEVERYRAHDPLARVAASISQKALGNIRQACESEIQAMLTKFSKYW